MLLFLQTRKASVSLKALSLFILLAFGLSTLTVYITRSPNSYASVLDYMPAPTKLITTSSAYYPVTLRGIKFYPEDPFQFDFILDEGDTSYHSDYSQEQLKQEAQRLIDYFLAALTVPEEDLWVNLSPHEKDRVIPPSLALTDMGRDMLGQDYVLKQLTASLTYPESETGRKFWDQVYQKAQELYGTTNLPLNTLNKVWIMPDKATVYEEADGAFLGETKLKVMLDHDYLALQQANPSEQADAMADPSAQIAREVIVPIIEEEVNTGKNFAHLRQTYDALVLATWFKQKLRKTFYDQVYLDKNKTKGIEGSDPQIKEKIYKQYLEAYQKGVYDYVRRDRTPTGQSLNRRYYSGGVIGKGVDVATTVVGEGDHDETSASNESHGETMVVPTRLAGRDREGAPIDPVTEDRPDDVDFWDDPELFRNQEPGVHMQQHDLQESIRERRERARQGKSSGSDGSNDPSGALDIAGLVRTPLVFKDSWDEIIAGQHSKVINVTQGLYLHRLIAAFTAHGQARHLEAGDVLDMQFYSSALLPAGKAAEATYRDGTLHVVFNRRLIFPPGTAAKSAHKDDVLRIVVDDAFSAASINYEILAETLTHEYHERVLKQDHDEAARAQIEAFSQGGTVLTPEHQWMLDNVNADQLRAIIDEYVGGRYAERPHQFGGLDQESQARYEELFYERAKARLEAITPDSHERSSGTFDTPRPGRSDHPAPVRFKSEQEWRDFVIGSGTPPNQGIYAKVS